MNIRNRFFVSPATVLAGLALFFALGGSAFAVGTHLQDAAAAQERCATGAVRGIAAVYGDPSAGIVNIGDQFTSARKVFRHTFNCSGRAVQVRRISSGVFEVRFVGNAAQSAVGSSVDDAYADVETTGTGTFKVSVHPAGRDDLSDRAFTVVAF